MIKPQNFSVVFYIENRLQNNFEADNNCKIENYSGNPLK